MLLRLARLDERHHFEELVESPKATGEGDHRLGEVEEPVFPDEEVVELEVELRGDVRVVALFEGQGDAQADRSAAGFEGAAVGGLHDSRAAARADQEALPLRQRERPLGHFEGEFAAGFVVRGAAQVHFRDAQPGGAFGARTLPAGDECLDLIVLGAGLLKGEGAGRPKHDHRVADVVFFEPEVGLGELRHDPNGPGLRAAHELLVQVGALGRGALLSFFGAHSPIFSALRPPAKPGSVGLDRLGGVSLAIPFKRHATHLPPFQNLPRPQVRFPRPLEDQGRS